MLYPVLKYIKKRAREVISRIISYLTSLLFWGLLCGFVLFYAENSEGGKRVLFVAVFGLTLLNVRHWLVNKTVFPTSLIVLCVIAGGLLIDILLLDFLLRLVLFGFGLFYLMKWINLLLETYVKPHQPTYTVIIKYFTYLILFFISTVLLYYILGSFIALYSNHYVTIWLSYVDWLCVFLAFLCLMGAGFVIEFLSSLIAKDLKFNGTPKGPSIWSSFHLFVKIFIVLVFTDLMFATAYLSFSETEASKQISGAEHLYKELATYFPKAWFYTFCLHFSVPLPPTEFYISMGHSIASYPYMKIVQFTHIILSKIVELTLLAALAAVVLKRISFEENSTVEA